MISLIVAMSRNGVIGKDNKLPWRLPADLAYFKKVTTGHTVIMGRKTFESIGKPLPNRRNVIITRNRDYKAVGCEVFHSVEEALEAFSGEEAFIIGGAEIYSLFLPFAHKLYITYIDEDFTGDTHFPETDFSNWAVQSKETGEKNEKNPYDYYFTVYGRN